MPLSAPRYVKWGYVKERKKEKGAEINEEIMAENIPI